MHVDRRRRNLEDIKGRGRRRLAMLVITPTHYSPPWVRRCGGGGGGGGGGRGRVSGDLRHYGARVTQPAAHALDPPLNTLGDARLIVCASAAAEAASSPILPHHAGVHAAGADVHRRFVQHPTQLACCCRLKSGGAAVALCVCPPSRARWAAFLSRLGAGEKRGHVGRGLPEGITAPAEHVGP